MIVKAVIEKAVIEKPAIKKAVGFGGGRCNRFKLDGVDVMTVCLCNLQLNH